VCATRALGRAGCCPWSLRLPSVPYRRLCHAPLPLLMLRFCPVAVMWQQTSCPTPQRSSSSAGEGGWAVGRGVNTAHVVRMQQLWGCSKQAGGQAHSPPCCGAAPNQPLFSLCACLSVPSLQQRLLPAQRLHHGPAAGVQGGRRGGWLDGSGLCGLVLGYARPCAGGVQR